MINLEKIEQLVKDKVVTCKKNDKGYKLFKYTRKTFFDGNFTSDETLECRGLVMDGDNIVTMPFTKLFNYGELQAPKIDLKETVLLVDKINGFLLIVSSYKGEIFYNTTGSFSNEYIEMAKELAIKQGVDFEKHIKPGYTYLFEVCHRNDPHIIEEKEGIYLIGRRSHTTGDMELEDMLDVYAMDLKAFRPSRKEVPFEVALSLVHSDKLEGYIVRKRTFIQDDNFGGKIRLHKEIPIMKLKSDYYKLCKVLARSEDARCLSKAEVYTRENVEYEELLHFVKENKQHFFALSELERLQALRTQKLTKRELSKKKLYLVRGLPGSGKSTFAETLCQEANYAHFEADQYFINQSSGEYLYDKTKIHQAHLECQQNTSKAMQEGLNIIVSNTFTTEKEMKPYYDLAYKFGYSVFSIVLENRHNGLNIHKVPSDTLIKMKERFDIRL